MQPTDNNTITYLDDESENLRDHDADEIVPSNGDNAETIHVIEALIFASDEPISFRHIKDVLYPGTSMDNGASTVSLDQEETGEGSAGMEESSPVRGRRRKGFNFTLNTLKTIVDGLNDIYVRNGNAFRIVEVAGGFTFQTTAEFGLHIGRLHAERARRRLTQAALETLAIIAFKQPVSKPAIEAIRGVNADYVLKSLLERNLIAIVGREDSVGRPLLYATTASFLKHFGLRSIEDLPKPREISELLAEDTSALPSIEELEHPQNVFHIPDAAEHLFDTARDMDKNPTPFDNTPVTQEPLENIDMNPTESALEPLHDDPAADVMSVMENLDNEFNDDDDFEDDFEDDEDFEDEDLDDMDELPDEFDEEFDDEEFDEDDEDFEDEEEL